MKVYIYTTTNTFYISVNNHIYYVLNYLDRCLVQFDLLIDMIKFIWHTELIKLSFKLYTQQRCINDNENKS